MTILSKVRSFLSRQEQKQGLLVLAMVMGMAALETVGIASVMPFLAVLGNPGMIQTNTILAALFDFVGQYGIHTAEQFLMVLGIGSFVLIVVSAAYRTVTQFVLNRFVEMRRHSIGLRLLQGYLRQPYEFFLNRHSSDLSKTILSEVDQLVLNVFRPVFSIFSYSLVVLSIIILMVFINPLLAVLVAAILGGLYILVFLGLRRKLLQLGEDRLAANKERFSAASEAFSSIKMLKLLGRESAYLDRFSNPSKHWASIQALHVTLSIVPNYIIEAVIFGTLLLFTVVLLGESGLNSGALGELLPVIGLYAFGVYRIKPAAQNIYNGVAALRYGRTVVDDLYNDLSEHKTPIREDSGSSDAPLLPKKCIELSGLSYRYPGSKRDVLHHLNLTIPVGSSVGLIGTTGAGKTTLVDIVLGLLRPKSGSIKVDGVALKDDQISAWQRILGYVPQDIVLTDSSIAENIAFGVSKAHIDFDQVRRCAELAQVYDFVMEELPNQFDTHVGERGVRLSGGQRQRIGIARALYRNPEVLVFDEATSALDGDTEKAVMDAIEALANKKTIILIAHRVRTLDKCDQIIKLEDGKIQMTKINVGVARS